MLHLHLQLASLSMSFSLSTPFDSSFNSKEFSHKDIGDVLLDVVPPFLSRFLDYTSIHGNIYKSDLLSFLISSVLSQVATVGSLRSWKMPILNLLQYQQNDSGLTTWVNRRYCIRYEMLILLYIHHISSPQRSIVFFMLRKLP